MGRRLDWSTCSFLTRVRLADLLMKQVYTDELFIQQNSIYDGQTTLSVQERPHHSQVRFRFLAHLIDIRRQGDPCIKDHSKITGWDRSSGLAV
jgi:hypothetical protein